jgi:hypothetical protein
MHDNQQIRFNKKTIDHLNLNNNKNNNKNKWINNNN